MKCYIYNADIYCEACGKDIRKRYRDKRHKDDGDSDTFPQGPLPVDESDYPKHCGSGDDCLDALELNGVKYGKFLENPLTSEGIEYVKETHAERPTDLTEMWVDFYGIETEDDEDESDDFQS